MQEAGLHQTARPRAEASLRQLRQSRRQHLDLSVLYYRVPRVFAAMALARGDGRYGKLLRQLARVNLLVLDDWGPEPLLPEHARDLHNAYRIELSGKSLRKRQAPEPAT
jgi:DNA replication protein DnaC